MKAAFCCVADDKTRYLVQAVRWAQSIRWFGGAHADAELFVGLTDPCPPAYARELDRLAVRSTRVPRASSWHGPSNKIGILAAPELAEFDCVVLSDCDVAFVADVSEWLDPRCISAKPADFATLGNPVLRGLFEAAGQPVPRQRLLTSISGASLIPYCNSGVVILGKEILRSFTGRWRHWNHFVLQNRHLLGDRAFFADQASFALALSGFLSEYRELPIGMNFPCHVAAERIPARLRSLVPLALHYHDKVDGRTGRLLETSLPGPDEAIRRFNQRLSAERKRHFSNAVFWDQRYLQSPGLGSGIGSRGAFVELKARVVAGMVGAHPGARVLDFGCGDCSLLDRVDIPAYVGIDASAEVIRSNRSRFPDREFICGVLPDLEVRGDLGLCFDVLIHQPDRATFNAVLDRVVELSAHGGLINGFDADPEFDSDIVYFHEPLREALARRGLSFEPVGEYRKTTVYRWAHQA